MSLGVGLPERMLEKAVGYDICINEDIFIPRGKRGLVETGFAIEMLEGAYGRIAPQSGLVVKRGINVGAGVIDPDYTKELGVVLFNHSNEGFYIKKGDQIV